MPHLFVGFSFTGLLFDPFLEDFELAFSFAILAFGAQDTLIVLFMVNQKLNSVDYNIMAYLSV